MVQGRRQYTDEFKREAAALLGAVVGRCCRSPTSSASPPRCCATAQSKRRAGGRRGRRCARFRRWPRIPPRARGRKSPAFARTIVCVWSATLRGLCFGTLRTELVRQDEYSNRGAARRDLFAYIEGYCNRQRRHSAIGYITPEQAEAKSA